MTFRSEHYIGVHTHEEGGNIKMWNFYFWNTINGIKSSHKYFIGKGFEDEEVFVAVLRENTENLVCIDIEKSEKSETIYYGSKFLNNYYLVFLENWIKKIHATIAFMRLKHKYELPEEEIIAFRVAEKLSGTSYPPSEMN